LIHYFLQEFAGKYQKELEGVSPAAQQMLMSFSWPGNVRQLRTAIENMVVLSTGKILDPETLPAEIQPTGSATEHLAGMDNLVGISIEQAEKELIRNTLKMVDGNREQAAKILRIGERTLYRKIREYGL
jgi:two-component system, NtrC family, response regulator HydG